MNSISLNTGLLISSILFFTGFLGVMIRRNILFMLISIEIMLNAAGLAFIFAGAEWHAPDGQIMFIFILTMAAAEVAVGLALLILFYQKFKTLNSDAASNMRG